MAPRPPRKPRSSSATRIVKGVARDVISINPIYDLLPFTPYAGGPPGEPRGTRWGDADFFAVDATITSKAAATFTQVPFSATKIIGDARLDGLVQAQSVSAGVDQMAVEVSSKAKSIGRKFQTGMATGTGTSPQMYSCTASATQAQFTTASAGRPLVSPSWTNCSTGEGQGRQVDWIAMPARTLRAYKTLVRAAGGATSEFMRDTNTGRTVDAWQRHPHLQERIPERGRTANGAALTGGALTLRLRGRVR